MLLTIAKIIRATMNSQPTKTTAGIHPGTANISLSLS